jgi:exodeoxyribonuclease V
MIWSTEQDAAIAAVNAWLRQPRGPQVFRLFGFAGTGKTTLAKELAFQSGLSVLFATFTGKASLVLRAKGCDGAMTLHSLVYEAVQDEVTGEYEFLLNQKSELADADLLIVDEVSMVGEELARDILSFGKKVLVLGDPAQLPPVKSEGFFINAAPDAMLTQVHRQALDNPIIRMSMDVREGRGLKPGQYGTSLVARGLGRDECAQRVLAADQVICGLNKSRVAYNSRIRTLKGLRGEYEPWHPAQGDRLICLKNDRKHGIFNGSMWVVRKTSIQESRKKLFLNLRSVDEKRAPLDSETFPHFFNGTENELNWKALKGVHQFTFGWAITAHKSQGSEWGNVVIFDESRSFGESARNWLYTALTRASDRVTVLL